MQRALKIQGIKIYIHIHISHFDFPRVSDVDLPWAPCLFLVSANRTASFPFAAVTSWFSGEIFRVRAAGWLSAPRAACILSGDNVLEIRQLAPALPYNSSSCFLAIYPHRSRRTDSPLLQRHARFLLLFFFFNRMLDDVASAKNGYRFSGKRDHLPHFDESWLTLTMQV